MKELKTPRWYLSLRAHEGVPRHQPRSQLFGEERLDFLLSARYVAISFEVSPLASGILNAGNTDRADWRKAVSRRG
jgi:hypothetical protein